MIIAVDAGCLGIIDEKLKLGVYQDAKNLLNQLGKIDTKNIYLLYSFHPIEKELLKLFDKRMKNIVVKPARGWLQIWLPWQIAKDNPDIFLALSQANPKRYFFSPKYYTIGLFHDISFEKYPILYEYSTPSKQWQQSRQLAKDAGRIVAVSEATKRDLMQIYEVPQEKIRVIYPGVDVYKVPPSHRRDLQDDKYPSKYPYFLFVGAFKKTKNIPTLIKAFAYFQKNTNKQYNLFLVGSDMWLDTEISTTLQTLSKKVKDNIHFLGFVSEEVLQRLYKSAVAFVSPSIDEGFGLTFLEAMSNGCAVIGSNAGSIPEVVGNAGILTEPMDIKGIVNAMKQLAQNKAKRATLIELGLRQSKKFTWEKFTKGIYSIITQYESSHS